MSRTIDFNEWPNQVRKIWYGDNDFGFWEAQERTQQLGYEIYFDSNLQLRLRQLR